jgi:integrase
MPRPTKGAHLYLRRRSGREPVWVIRDGGHEIGTGCAGGEREGAEKKLSSYLAAKYRPDFGNGDPSKIPVADVLALYAKERAPVTKRPERIAYALAPLAQFWGDKMVDGVTAGRCRDYARWRAEQPIASYKRAPRRLVCLQTARRELVVLRAAINYAFREGKLIYPVPIALPSPGATRTRWLTRSEAARLLWAAWRQGNRHVARFILVALYTGSRHDAVLRLRWLPSVDAGWVDLEQGLIYRKGIGESESSKRRPPVPISPRLAAHLRRWKDKLECSSVDRAAGCKAPESAPVEDQRDGGSIPSTPANIYVISWGGLPISHIRRAWHTARCNAGLGPEVVPHVLRHTFASWAVQAGHSFAEVAAALGTTEQVVERTYGHFNLDRMRLVVASVARRGA